MTTLEKLFQGDLPKQVMADLEEQIERRARLHAAAAQTGVAQPRLAGLGPPSAGPVVRPVLASLGKPHLQLLKRFSDANVQQRGELAVGQRTKLFSIVHANYRPGPAYLTGHEIAQGALTQRIMPGGATWRDLITPAGFSLLARIARQCLRLDRQSGQPTGSGFLLSDGTVLTARHVVEEPGWIFGQPPDPAQHPGRVRYNQVNAAAPPETNIQSNACHFSADAQLDLACLQQSAGWRPNLEHTIPEFAALPGLVLQSVELAPSELAGREVAVIGHPLSGNSGGSDEDIQTVFSDATLGTKRLMPGTIDAEAPLVSEMGQTAINHNCSTLGGASGACLVDLKTGVVLGLHRAGDASLGNRAIPAWVLAQQLAAPGVWP